MQILVGYQEVGEMFRPQLADAVVSTGPLLSEERRASTPQSGALVHALATF